MSHHTEKIWTEFSNQLKQYILGRVADKSLADDILQDVFIKIHSRIETLKDDTKIKSWVYQITRNTIIDHYRGQKITVDIPKTFAEFDEISQSNCHQHVSSGLKSMINELPEKYREALLLTEFQGLSQKELAQRLDMSVSGAKSRVQRARQKLKLMLLECCHFEFDRYGTILDYHRRSPKCAGCSTATKIRDQ